MNVTERFLRYVSYPTNSDEQSESCPSTAGQLALGAALAEALKAIGLTDGSTSLICSSNSTGTGV